MAVVNDCRPRDTFFLDPAELDCLGTHLRRLGWLFGESLVSAERIGQGNMNLTVRIRTDRQSFILKQARPWVERYPHIAAPVERAGVEAAFYRIVSVRPGIATQMPRLHGFDAGASLIWFEDLGEETDLTSLYGSNGPSEELCRSLTDFLSSLHEVRVPDNETQILRNRAMRSLNHVHQYELPLREDNGLDLEQITPGLTKAAVRLQRDREYFARVTDLARLYLADGASLVHGDFFPGSWLRTERGLVIIDPEFSFLGPSEYDLGIFLAHLELAGAGSLWGSVEGHYRGAADWRLVRRFAGAEIMRRLIGVAQLPILADLDTKRAWLELSRSLVCAV